MINIFRRSSIQLVFCKKSSGRDAPTWRHFTCSCKNLEIRRILNAELASLHLFFFTWSTPIFNSFSRNDTFFFPPCALNKYTPSPLLPNASHSNPHPYFNNCMWNDVTSVCVCLITFCKKNHILLKMSTWNSVSQPVMFCRRRMLKAPPLISGTYNFLGIIM